MWMMLPSPRRHHQRQHRAAHQVGAADVHGEHAVPLVRRDVADRPARVISRSRIDENVYDPESVARRRRGAKRVRLDADVAAHGDDLAAGSRNRRGGRVRGRCIAIDAGDRGSGMRECQRDGARNAVAGAGHDRDFVVQASVRHVGLPHNAMRAAVLPR
jgi:hypothetical protein